MNLTIENTTNLTNWDEHLSQHKGSVFLTRGWLEAMKTEARKPVYYVFKQNQEVKAMIAGLERPVGQGDTKQLFFFSGIASSQNDPELLKECKNKLLEYARENLYFRVIMKTYDYNITVPSLVPSYKDFQRSECVIDLSLDTQELVNRIDRDTRRRVRKAKKAGAEFKYSNSPQLLDSLFSLMNATQEVRQSKGYGSYQMYTMPFLDREVMTKLLDSKAATLYYIALGEEILSIQFVVAIAARAYGIWMGTSPLGYRTAAPSALFYEIIMKHKKDGYQSYNMGGIPLGSRQKGLKHYKLELGATLLDTAEQTTDFLLPPLSRLNSFMLLKRRLLNIPIPWRMKKVLIRPLDGIIGGRDAY